MREQLADDDHGLGDAARQEAGADRQEPLHLASRAKSADLHDQFRVAAVEAQVVPAREDRVQWQDFVVVSCFKDCILFRCRCVAGLYGIDI